MLVARNENRIKEFEHFCTAEMDIQSSMYSIIHLSRQFMWGFSVLCWNWITQLRCLFPPAEMDFKGSHYSVTHLSRQLIFVRVGYFQSLVTETKIELHNWGVSFSCRNELSGLIHPGVKTTHVCYLVTGNRNWKKIKPFGNLFPAEIHVDFQGLVAQLQDNLCESMWVFSATHYRIWNRPKQFKLLFPQQKLTFRALDYVVIDLSRQPIFE